MARMERKRLIHIRDWNESSVGGNAAMRGTTIHEIAHNWDSNDEDHHHPGGTRYWTDFKDAHDRSDSLDDYARAYGMTNIREDFATCVQAAMGYSVAAMPAAPSAELLDKMDAVDRFFDDFV